MYTVFSRGIGRLGTILAFGLALWAAAAATAIADDDQRPMPVYNYDPGDGGAAFAEGPWYLGAEGVAIQRIFQGLGPVATLGASPTGSLALSQQSMDRPFQAGYRVWLGHSFGDSPYQVEMSYLSLSPFDTSAQFNDPTGRLSSPFTNFGATPNASVDNNSLVQIHQVSRMESGEINFKHCLPLPWTDPRVVLMLGVKYVGVREEFDYSSQPTTNVNPVSVHAHTNNVLWGPQIGGLVDYGHETVWLRFEGHAAICDNSADRDLSAAVGGANVTHPTLFHNSTATTADIAATVIWRPTAALTAKVGYQAMWYDQLALAGRNYAPELPLLTNPAADLSINTRGTLIYHGPFAGLQVRW